MYESSGAGNDSPTLYLQCDAMRWPSVCSAVDRMAPTLVTWRMYSQWLTDWNGGWDQGQSPAKSLWASHLLQLVYA